MDITISSVTGKTPLRGFPDDTFSLRAYSEYDYITDDGQPVLAGDEKTNYREVTGGTLDPVTKIPSYPSFVLPATTDASSDQTSVWTVCIVDSRGKKREMYFERYEIPHTLGPTLTLEQLTIHNEATIPVRDTTTLTRAQIETLLSTIAHPNASAVLKGYTKLSDAPADSANPIAEGANSARLAALSAATHLNTPSAIVRRDASGNFAGGAFTGSVTGSVTGAASLNVLKTGDVMTGPLSGPLRDNGGAVYNIKADPYNAKGDLKRRVDGAITSGLTTLTSATASFAPTDVGKSVFVDGAGVAGAVLSTTISGFTNSTTVTLALAASTTVSGANFSFGTDDTLAIRAAIAAAEAAGPGTPTTGGGRLRAPSGNYLVSNVGGGTEIFLITRSLILEGDGQNSRICVAPTVGASVDVIRYSPLIDTTAPHWWSTIQFFTVRSLNLCPAAVGLPARYGVFLDTLTANKVIAQAVIEECSIGGFGGASVALVNHVSDPDGTYLTAIRRNQLYGGLLITKGGDSLQIVDNAITDGNVLSGGTSTAAVDIDQTPGAVGLWFIRNNVTVSKGVLIRAGGAPIIRDNEIELVSPDTGTAAGAALDMAGTASTIITGAVIDGNTLVIDTGIAADGIRLDYCQAAAVTNNFIDQRNGTRYQIKYTANSSGNLKGYNRFIGAGLGTQDLGTNNIDPVNNVGGVADVTGAARPTITVTTTGTTGKARIHSQLANNTSLTQNISYNGSTWGLDDTTLPGWMASLDGRTAGDNFSVIRASAGANPRTPVTFLSINAAGVTGFFKGADVASASTIVPTGSVFVITGTTTISNISTTGIQPGTVLHMITTSAVTFDEAGNIDITGATSLTTTAGYLVITVWDSVKWRLR